MRRRRVAFLALGTRGDIQPMLWLASRLAERCACDCVVATHADLGAQLLHELPAALMRGVTLELAPPTSLSASACDGAAREALRASEREALVRACAAADGVVFNLFALEGHSLAEARGIPAVAVSPFWQAERCPRALVHAVDSELPDVAAALRRTSSGLGGCDTTAGAAPVRWPDIDAWQWRLLLDDHGDWRQRRLGLSPNFLTYALDTTGELPATVPLIYLLSSLLLRRDELASLPRSVYLVGPCSPPWTCAASAAVAERDKPGPPPLPPGVRRLRVYVGFGSMEALHLVCAEDAARFVHGVAAALLRGPRAASWHVEIVCHSVTPASAVVSSVAPVGHERVTVAPLVGGVDYDRLFPTCDVIVHHGGAGTVAAAALHGVPQVIVPFLFDQPDWAARVTEAGLGCALPPLADLVASGHANETIEHALQRALALADQATLRNTAKLLQDESRENLDRAVSIIARVLRLERLEP